jgi:non-specific serine/threonine protein kinase
MAADPDFVLNDDNACLVTEICRRLDGIPLGLELAAVRVRTLTLNELVNRLDDQLSLANLNSRTSPARHRTLESTLDWSHDLMSEQEQILWRRLSVFYGGFTLGSAGTVCADDELPADAVFDALTGLSEKSIVVADRDHAGRHRLLEPVRLYGRERLRAAGEECELLDRHRRWCSELAAGPEGAWWTGRDQLRWIAEVTDEQANLRAALDYCLRESDEEVVRAGLQIAADLWLPWVVRGWYSELRRYLEGLLAKGVSSPEQGRALVAASSTARTQGDLDAAERLIDQYGQLLDGSPQSPFERALGLYEAAITGLARGHADPARARLEEAVELFASTDAAVFHTLALYFLAEAWAADDPDAAYALLRESLAISEERGEICVRSVVHGRIGVIEWLLGDPRSGEEHIKEGLRLQRELGHRWGTAANLEGLAWIAAAGGHPDRAAGLLGAADALWDELQIAEPQPLTVHRDACERVARATLGESRFLALYDEGRALGLEETLALALGEARAETEVTEGGALSLLTRRELEVVRLVATGATNREVAASLVISYQTVKTHLHHILAKLGFESRVELAAWYARQQS